jgi:hypothetical protein
MRDIEQKQQNHGCSDCIVNTKTVYEQGKLFKVQVKYCTPKSTGNVRTVFCCKQCHLNNNIKNTEYLQNTDPPF